MKTAILLGAGSSLPAGFPSTQRLTDLVLSGDRVWRHSDSSYYLNGDASLPDEQTPLANRMARRIHAEAERYYSANAGRSPNYEDLFYLADQAWAEELGEMENPAVRTLASELRADMSTLIGTENGLNYFDLLNETRNYIADVVWKSLCPKPVSTNHLKIIARACESGTVSSISTLCHDTHVEAFLREQSILLADGFSDEKAGVRYWSGDLSSNGKIPFLKLHGSVDWFRLRPDNSKDFFDDQIGIPLNGDRYHTKTEAGISQLPVDGRPLLLIGTFNKILNYSGGMFRELHYRFRSKIREANQLVVCGYSFGDKGINSEIIEWYYAERGRRFVIIHPDREELVTNARGSIKNKWDKWEKNGSVVFIAKRLENVDIDEFLKAI